MEYRANRKFHASPGKGTSQNLRDRALPEMGPVAPPARPIIRYPETVGTIPNDAGGPT
ncbi:MAG: hypothetical protein SFU56_02670 [Capsulimonadales bacterium]|nr:hypothetical protein [Capsulimonadales bacterium]